MADDALSYIRSARPSIQQHKRQKFPAIGSIEISGLGRYERRGPDDSVSGTLSDELSVIIRRVGDVGIAGCFDTEYAEDNVMGSDIP